MYQELLNQLVHYHSTKNLKDKLNNMIYPYKRNSPVLIIGQGCNLKVFEFESPNCYEWASYLINEEYKEEIPTYYPGEARCNGCYSGLGYGFGHTHDFVCSDCINISKTASHGLIVERSVKEASTSSSSCDETIDENFMGELVETVYPMIFKYQLFNHGIVNVQSISYIIFPNYMILYYDFGDVENDYIIVTFREDLTYYSYNDLRKCNCIKGCVRKCSICPNVIKLRLEIQLIPLIFFINNLTIENDIIKYIEKFLI